MQDVIIAATVTLLVTIDPPGLAPLFLAVTRGMDRQQRNQVAWRAPLIAFALLALFAVAGAGILSVFGITLPAFRVAGGLLLFSNNYRRFRLDEAAVAEFASCIEISAKTIDPDFERNPRIHRCWELRRA